MTVSSLARAEPFVWHLPLSGKLGERVYEDLSEREKKPVTDDIGVAHAVLKRPEAGNRSLVLVNDNIGNDGIYGVQF